MPSRSGSDHQHEILEVEDVEQRRRRLQDILERLNGEGSSTEQQSPNLSFDFGARRTFAIEPPAELLARVQDFLPQIERSNVELLQRDPRSIDIEHIEGTDERVVEMDLGLGVFEQRPPARRLSSISSSSSSSSSGSLGRVTGDSSSTASESESESESFSDPEDDDANEDGSSGPPRLRPTRPLPKRQSPMIQVLASEDEDISFESAGDRPAP